MLKFSATLWKLISHLHTVSLNYISTSRMVLFFKKPIFPSELHLYLRSGTPVANMCRVQKFTRDVRKAKWTRNVHAYSLELLPLCPSPLCLSSLTFIHTLTQTNTFILDVTAELCQICFLVLSAHFILLLFLSVFLSFFTFFPTSCFCLHLALGLLLHCKGHIHVTSTFKTKCTCVSEGTAVWGQVNLDFKMW